MVPTPKYVAPQIIDSPRDELLVVAASIGTNKRRRAIRNGITDVVRQVAQCSWRVAFWPANSDPCLQLTDYCVWAVQRKFERNDDRSYRLIEAKIESEFEPFKSSSTSYY